MTDKDFVGRGGLLGDLTKLVPRLEIGLEVETENYFGYAKQAVEGRNVANFATRPGRRR